MTANFNSCLFPNQTLGFDVLQLSSTASTTRRRELAACGCGAQNPKAIMDMFLFDEAKPPQSDPRSDYDIRRFGGRILRKYEPFKKSTQRAHRHYDVDNLHHVRK